MNNALEMIRNDVDVVINCYFHRRSEKNHEQCQNSRSLDKDLFIEDP